MLISVHHVTRYKYDEEARYSIQTLRVTPQSFGGHDVKDWTVSAPGIERAVPFRDSFGNIVHQTTILDPHDEIVVEVNGTVETADRAGVVVGTLELSPPRVYLRETALTKPDDAIREIAAAALSDGGNILGRLHTLMHHIADKVAYEPGNTHSETTAAEALAKGSGVCQDHAHIMIACTRAMGQPSRYVHGFLVGEATGGHGWAEVFVDGLGWVGFDPTNRICPVDTYVRVAVGLDADAAPPIKGTRRGGGEETLEVSVSAAPQAGQSQSSGAGTQSQSQ
ncbi:MAG: transglutaminase domain-containing protein [Hyphomicrobiaceae bacterium]